MTYEGYGRDRGGGSSKKPDRPAIVLELDSGILIGTDNEKARFWTEDAEQLERLREAIKSGIEREFGIEPAEGNIAYERMVDRVLQYELDHYRNDTRYEWANLADVSGGGFGRAHFTKWVEFAEITGYSPETWVAAQQTLTDTQVQAATAEEQAATSANAIQLMGGAQIDENLWQLPDGSQYRVGENNEPVLVRGARRFLGGFDDQYSVEREVPQHTEVGVVYGSMFTETAEPQYREHDQWRDFAGKSPAYIAEVQAALEAAGLLTEDGYSTGTWDVDSARAMEVAMVEANARGGTWVAILQERSEAAAENKLDEQKRRNPFVTPTYRKPDYARVATATRAAFQAEVGRELHDYELELLADELTRDFRRQYDSDVSALRMEHDAGNRAIAFEEDQSSGSVQSVDPMARLQERIREMYAPEVAAEKAESEHAFNSSLMFRSLAGLERSI